MRRWIFFIFFSSLCLALPVCVKRLTHGFRIDKIKFELPFHAEWEISPLSPKSLDELLAIFSQPFYYLDRGAQSYVFQSEDERYVIKFFRMDRPRNPVRQWVREKIKKRSSSPRNFEKVDKLFSACKLAYTMAQEETELLYLHLNRTESLLPSLKLRSSLGNSFSLPLDCYYFALQKKVKPLKEALLSALDSGKMEDHLDAIISLLEKRSLKGISNADRNLFRNFGFINEKAVEIDFGNYNYSKDLCLPAKRKEEISRFLSSLRTWLQGNAPEWVFYLDQQTNF